MYYWNRPNFEGLRAVAEALETRPALRQLGAYCRLREQGLRRRAFDELGAFLSVAAGWSPADARGHCQFILELHARTPEAHQFLSQPLNERFIFPVLTRWEAEHPTERHAVRWLGLLRRDPGLLQRALALAPEDVPVRRCLVDWHLSAVDHATHHLVESRFLGTVEDAEASLSHARDVLEAGPELERLADLKSELEEFESLLADWREYASEPVGSFPEWCSARERQYAWPKVFYYDQ